MKKEFEWDNRKRELIEITTGTELIDANKQKVDGSYRNELHYPENTARNFIHELERQIGDIKAQQEAIDKQLEKAREKIGPVDPVFLKKLEAAMAKMQIKQQEEAKDNVIKSLFDIESKLQQIKRAMGPDYVG